MGTPDHLSCLLKNLYADQEATVRTRHRTDWFKFGKEVCKVYLLSPCLFNLHAEEYNIQNTGLDNLPARIKIRLE